MTDVSRHLPTSDPTGASVTTPDIVARHALACTLARSAGRLALAFFRERDTLQIEHKGLQDVVSRADRDVEQFIRAGIANAFPDDAFLGEESASEQRAAVSSLGHVAGGQADKAAPDAGAGVEMGQDGLTGASQSALWVVDPIDGTTCFLQGMPVWCISIGVVIDGVPRIGAVYDPNTDELFHAMDGAGAWLSTTGPNGVPVEKRLLAHHAASFRDGPLGLGYSHNVPASTVVPFLDTLLAEGGMFIRNGSGALMIAYVAAGRLIGYYEPFMHPWDCMAGLVLVREAGGIAEDFLAGDGLRRGNRVIVAGPRLFTSLWQAVDRTSGIVAR
ncbi:inositol monophosphatase family protein [Robbsia andropogonis]|uniref:inositol monophosphatase family protein n=1 Tax=Robbsia andropogonis TaxID=28092 RepID=UPI000465B44A|nr:inositol monophosphatase family protein [Robbsia andropogonis]